MISLLLATLVALFAALATLVIGLIVRRLPPLPLAFVGSMVTCISYAIYTIVFGVIEGAFRDPGDLKYIGIPLSMGFPFTIPGALAGAGLISVWRRWKGRT